MKRFLKIEIMCGVLYYLDLEGYENSITDDGSIRQSAEGVVESTLAPGDGDGQERYVIYLSLSWVNGEIVYTLHSHSKVVV